MKPAFLSSRYYLKFGLDRDPFPQNSSQNKLFLTHELTRLMDELTTVIKMQDGILVVESSPGGGKTVLAAYLDYVKEANWYLSLINATEKLGKTELAHAIISQYFPRHRFGKTQPSVILQEFLQLYRRNGKLPVVVIDDAHLLPKDTLKFLMEIASLRYEGGQYRIILFADELLAKQLDRLSLKDPQSAALEYKNIPSFSKGQTEKYLEHRLSLSGNCRLVPFDKDDIERIFRKSASIPGEINKFAIQHMQDVVIPGRLRRIFIRTTTSIAAGLILFVVAYASMTGNVRDRAINNPVSITLELPDTKVQRVNVGKEKESLTQSPTQVAVMTGEASKEISKTVAKESPMQKNKNVLLADMKRQTKIRVRKIVKEREKMELRMQLAAYDSLTLRISDVVKN